MKYKDLLLGVFIGFVTAILGMFLFLKAFTFYNLFSDLQLLKQQGILGKVVTLGAILNILIFFILLKKGKEVMARGVVLSLILLTIFTLFL
jgi:uncharacterized membrane protein